MESDNNDQDSPKKLLSDINIYSKFNSETHRQHESPEPTSQQPEQPLQPVTPSVPQQPVQPVPLVQPAQPSRTGSVLDINKKRQTANFDIEFAPSGVTVTGTSVKPPIARVIPVPLVASYPERAATFNSCSIQSQLRQVLDRIAYLERDNHCLRIKIRAAHVRLGQKLQWRPKALVLPPTRTAAANSTCSTDTQTEVPVVIPTDKFVPPPRRMAEPKSTCYNDSQTEGPVVVSPEKFVPPPRRMAEPKSTCYKHTQTEGPGVVSPEKFVPPPRRTAEPKSTCYNHTQTEGPVAVSPEQLVCPPRRNGEATTSCSKHTQTKLLLFDVQKWLSSFVFSSDSETDTEANSLDDAKTDEPPATPMASIVFSDTEHQESSEHHSKSDDEAKAPRQMIPKCRPLSINRVQIDEIKATTKKAPMPHSS